jgi:hypothetical protein
MPLLTCPIFCSRGIVSVTPTAEFVRSRRRGCRRRGGMWEARSGFRISMSPLRVQFVDRCGQQGRWGRWPSPSEVAACCTPLATAQSQSAPPSAHRRSLRSNTHLADWCDQHRFRSVVVVSTPDHSRRLRRVLHRSMKGHQTRVTVRPALLGIRSRPMVGNARRDPN